jgi:transcriptional regulator with XRE-family HTH domain
MLTLSQPNKLAGSMTAEEQQFFKGLGARLAALRKAQGLSQQALADQVGIAQQTLAHYEVGRARPPVSLMPEFSRIFGVAVDELLGQPVRAAGKRGPAPKLQQQMERISRLPRAQQRIVMQMLDGVLAQASR